MPCNNNIKMEIISGRNEFSRSKGTTGTLHQNCITICGRMMTLTMPKRNAQEQTDMRKKRD